MTVPACHKNPENPSCLELIMIKRTQKFTLPMLALHKMTVLARRCNTAKKEEGYYFIETRGNF